MHKKLRPNSFFTQSFSDRILSLRMCLRIFLFSSFQLICAALFLGTYSVSMSFRNLNEQLCSPQLCRSTLDSLIIQLDLVTSLSLTGFHSTRCRYQLPSDSFDRSSFEHRALPCAALLDATRIRTQLQNRQVQSFQRSMQQFCFGLVQGGVQHRASYQPALQPRALSTALTLTSLSFALDAWLKTSSNRAWKRRPLRKSLCSRSLSTRSSQTASHHKHSQNQQQVA